MSYELLIMRHGKSDWGSGEDDYHRPLSGRGKRSAKSVGAWLLRQGLLPDYVISSPAQRAIATARKTCKAAGMATDGIVTDRSIYLASAITLLTVLRDVPVDAKRVLLVGHNPGLDELLFYLGGEPIHYGDDGKLLPTAAIARLQLPHADEGMAFPRGCARLLSLTRARSLQASRRR